MFLRRKVAPLVVTPPPTPPHATGSSGESAVKIGSRNQDLELDQQDQDLATVTRVLLRGCASGVAQFSWIQRQWVQAVSVAVFPVPICASGPLHVTLYRSQARASPLQSLALVLYCGTVDCGGGDRRLGAVSFTWLTLWSLTSRHCPPASCYGHGYRLLLRIFAPPDDGLGLPLHFPNRCRLLSVAKDVRPDPVRLSLCLCLQSFHLLLDKLGVRTALSATAMSMMFNASRNQPLRCAPLHIHSRSRLSPISTTTTARLQSMPRCDRRCGGNGV